MSGSRARIQGVIFDLDGVLVCTDELHFRAWKEMADREGIEFTHQDNNRLRGVDRMGSLEIILEKSVRRYSLPEMIAMADAKNARYRELLAALTPADVLPGARELLAGLRALRIRTAVGSSSRNAREIVRRVGLGELLDTVVDGNDIRKAKPDPEVFVLAASRLGLPPAQCVVVEDADTGVEAARRGGFRVIRIGLWAGTGLARSGERWARGLNEVTAESVLDMGNVEA